MSLTAKRTCTYSFGLFLIFAILVFIPICLLAQEAAHPFATAQAEPLPWWRQVEDFQNLAVKWVGALTVVLGALATLCAFLIAKYQEIAGRLSRQEERHEKAVEALKPKEVTVVNDGAHPVPTTTPKPPMLPIIIVGVIFLCAGCATTTTTRPDGTVTTTRYTDPKAMRELSNAVGIIGAAAAQEAIRQMVDEQNAR